MFTASQAIFVSSQAHRLVTDPSPRMGRKLRRFLAGACAEILPGELHLAQSYANMEGYSPVQLAALNAFAHRLASEHDALRPDVLFDRANVVFDECFGIVTVYYKLKFDIRAASVRQLKEALTFLSHIAGDMSAQLRDPNTTALADCPDYVYRGLPCSVVEEDELWCVSGGDVRTHGGGVLEWCVSESDAQDVLAQMKRFPERFINVHAEPWTAVNGQSAAAELALA